MEDVTLDTTRYINICLYALTHIFWIIISVHCTYSLYYFCTFPGQHFVHSCTAVHLFHFKNRYFVHIFYNIFIMFLLSFLGILYLCFLTFAALAFHLSLIFCHAPKYQGKFLVCENLLGNKRDSESWQRSERIALLF